MGNCCEDSKLNLNDKNPQQIILQQNNSHILNFVVISQLRSLPPISKNILNRMQQLGPFHLLNYKDYGPIYQLKNKSVYQGLLRNKLFNGPGRLILHDGTVIQSQFQNGLPMNRTRIFKTNGDYFSGNLPKNGELSLGIVHQKGITYQGQLLNKKPHGNGKEYSKTYTYIGKFLNGAKVNGQIQWFLDSKNKQSYKGKFKDNLFTGFGTLINNAGKYVGNFENGDKQGYGEMYFASGKIYKGMFKKNKQEGQGKIYDSQGRLLEQGKWLNGKKLIQQTSL